MSNDVPPRGSDAQHDPDSSPRQGGFRADGLADTERGGPRYGELVVRMREFMDRARAANPSEELTAELIDDIAAVNAKLAAVGVDERRAPSGTRVDLPSRGNITLPPYRLDSSGPEGIIARITFTRFHLGGNGAAHGGYICTAFDDILGMTSALASGDVVRTAYLTVNYRSITPLDTELVLATSVTRREGRKVFVAATLHDGDRLCAEADGLFLTLKPGQP